MCKQIIVICFKKIKDLKTGIRRFSEKNKHNDNNRLLNHANIIRILK
jgi:hypothetical protein